jgi:hypothetical protein
MPLPHSGVYEALLDHELNSILELHPELRSVFGKLDPEEAPARYASFLGKILEQALRLQTDPESRLRLCNEIIEKISAGPKAGFLQDRRLIPREEPILLEVTPSHSFDHLKARLARPSSVGQSPCCALKSQAPGWPIISAGYPLGRD